MDKHKTMRNHIAAAKGWLTQAEESLEQENDIRGDLKLMLAQAELRSAQEKRPQKAWLLWGRRLLPLVAALCVAAGYVAYLRPVPKEPVVPPAMPAAVEQSVGAGREADAAAAGPVAGDYHEAPVPAVPEMAAAENPGQGRDALLQRQVTGAEAVPEAAGQEAKPAAVQAEVPDIELQKLMQAAGNVLRE
ncbi:MAG: hypothetical protein ACI3U2_00160 [Anaerovibrio sp.]